MNDEELKSYFHHYLQRGRDAVVWKLEGLSEYDVRRPLVGTGTNLLGLVKHLTYGIPTCPTSLRTSGRRTASGSRRLLWDFGKARVVHLEQRRLSGYCRAAQSEMIGWCSVASRPSTRGLVGSEPWAGGAAARLALHD